MAPARDLYEILGIERGASDDEIRTAYRRLARELHPDVNAEPRSEERFKEVAGAYEILSDPEKRARYDAFGAGGPGGQPFADISDIFEMFFGQGGFGGIGSRRRGPRTRTRRGEDVGVRLRLSFSEAAFGVREDVQIERLVVCDRCLGNGAEPGTAPIACRTCGGTGEVQSVRRSVFGTLMTASPCATCGGTGQEIPDPCELCAGQGRIRQPSTVAVEIPAGVSDGMELRVTGSGHAGVAGGPAGDLFVRLEVETAERFERRGQDLFAVLDISVSNAALGGDVRIEGIDGTETIRVDAGTESGTIVRLKGKGIPNLNRRGRGDLFVTLHVVTPRELSREERELLSRLAELRGEPRNGAATAGRRRPARPPRRTAAQSSELGVGSLPMSDPNCLFCKIAAREVPAEILRESDRVIAFRDINPQAPTHILLIPKEHIESLDAIRDGHGALLADIVQAAAHLAHTEGVDESGWRLVSNVGPDAGQAVFHLHFHLLGGRPMGWPPG